MQPYNHPEELIYLIAFSMLKSINECSKKKCIEQFGSAKNAYDAFQEDAQLCQYKWPFDKAKKEIEFINKHQITAITIKEANYPNRLLHCEDAPIVMYLKGNPQFNLPHLISVVGSRRHTIQVNKIVKELIEGLQHLPIGIISGLAQGVDGIVHQTALQKQLPTWAVLGHGLDQIYPPQHRSLAIKMLTDGGLITEFASNTPPLSFHFPKRNRIVAGMSDCTIVVESGLKGGSMITASVARDYNREVFAVPGKIHDPRSEGCLSLIKKNTAQLYHDPTHLLECLNWPSAPPKLPIISTPTLQLNLKETHKILLLYIENQGPLHYDILSTQFKLPPSQLAQILLELELKGFIYRQAGNLYARKLI